MTTDAPTVMQDLPLVIDTETWLHVADITWKTFKTTSQTRLMQACLYFKVVPIDSKCRSVVTSMVIKPDRLIPESRYKRVKPQLQRAWTPCAYQYQVHNFSPNRVIQLGIRKYRRLSALREGPS